MQQMLLFGLLTCTKLICHDCLIPSIVIQAHGFFKRKENSGKQMTLVTTKVEAKVVCKIVVCSSSSLSLQCVS